MTFCAAFKVAEGLVGIADTRVTTGSERITARKVTIHQYGQHSMFLMTSGLRSARDKALTYFDEMLEETGASFDKLYKAVNALAEQVRRVAQEDSPALQQAGLAFNLYSIVGGQLENDREHKLYLLYPQGNWVEVGRGTPYYLIGESAYGKPLLDRVLRYESSLARALKAGYLAFDATRISATHVEFPIDVVLYRRDTYTMLERRYHYADLSGASQWWEHALEDAVERMPEDWVADAVSSLPPAPGPNGGQTS